MIIIKKQDNWDTYTLVEVVLIERITLHNSSHRWNVSLACLLLRRGSNREREREDIRTPTHIPRVIVFSCYVKHFIAAIKVVLACTLSVWLIIVSLSLSFLSDKCVVVFFLLSVSLLLLFAFEKKKNVRLSDLWLRLRQNTTNDINTVDIPNGNRLQAQLEQYQLHCNVHSNRSQLWRSSNM